MAAIIAGANCVHGCAIGLGERVGNTQIDQMLVNLKLMGIAPWDQQDMTKLKQYMPGSIAGDVGVLGFRGIIPWLATMRAPHRNWCARLRDY